MKILVAAVGRLRDGHEAALTADYLQRAAVAGRQLGFKSVELVEGFLDGGQEFIPVAGGEGDAGDPQAADGRLGRGQWGT